MDFAPVIILAVVVLILLGVVWYVVTRFLVNVGAQEVAIKERRYLGKRMPQGMHAHWLANVCQRDCVFKCPLQALLVQMMASLNAAARVYRQSR